MLKKLSFLEAHELLLSCEQAVEVLKPILGDMLYTIHDAVNLYAQSPDNWGCEEEADYAALFALALSQSGYNMLKPENDVTLKFLKPSEGSVKPQDG